MQHGANRCKGEQKLVALKPKATEHKKALQKRLHCFHSEASSHRISNGATLRSTSFVFVFLGASPFGPLKNKHSRTKCSAISCTNSVLNVVVLEPES